MILPRQRKINHPCLAYRVAANGREPSCAALQQHGTLSGGDAFRRPIHHLDLVSHACVHRPCLDRGLFFHRSSFLRPGGRRRRHRKRWLRRPGHGAAVGRRNGAHPCPSGRRERGTPASASRRPFGSTGSARARNHIGIRRTRAVLKAADLRIRRLHSDGASRSWTRFAGPGKEKGGARRTPPDDPLPQIPSLQSSR